MMGKRERGSCRTCHFAKWAVRLVAGKLLEAEGQPVIACLRYPPTNNAAERAQVQNAPAWVCPMMPAQGWCGEYVESVEGEPLPWDWREPVRIGL